MTNTQHSDPTMSPFFVRYDYTGNAIQKATKTGPKKAIFQNEESYYREKWLEDGGKESLMGFSDSYPEQEVVEVDKATGERKTITLKKWVLNQDAEDDLGYYYKESPWAFRCINIKAQALSAVPWEIRADGSEDPLPETHDAVVLLQEANPESNWEDLIQALSKDLDIYGKAFLWKVRSGKDSSRENTDGEIQFVLRLNPKSMEVKADATGISHFEQTVSGRITKYARENVAYFHEYDPDNDFGSVSPTDAAKKAIRVEIETDKHLAAFFKNKAMPATLMTTKEPIQDKELRKLMRQWGQNFKGSENQHKTGWTSHGFEPRELSYSPDKLALGEIREETRREICTSYGVPPSLAGAWEAANYATADIQRKFLYTEVVLPRGRYMEGVINAEVLNEFGGIYFIFIEDGLAVMQEDMNTKSERVTRLVLANVITPEAGALEMGYEETDVPEKAPMPDFTPKSIPEDDSPLAESKAGMESDIGKWKSKAIKRVKKDRPASCPFESDSIPDILHAVITDGLKEAKTVQDVHDVFAGTKPIPTPETKPEIKVEAHIHNEMPENRSPDVFVDIKQPDVNVNVEPTPVTVEQPDIEVNIEAPEVKIANPTIEEHIHIDVPKARLSKERQEVIRDTKNLISGSETTTEYLYDEDID